MEKYGVAFEEGLEKTGGEVKTPGGIKVPCHECGSELDGPRHCPKCGTKPWEKRPEKEGK